MIPLSIHKFKTYISTMGVVGEAKVSCIVRHRGVQLRLTYSWARRQVSVGGDGFIFSVSSLSFIFVFLPFPSLLSPLFLHFPGRRHKMTHKGWYAVEPKHNQSIRVLYEFVYQKTQTIARKISGKNLKCVIQTSDITVAGKRFIRCLL